MTGRPSSIKTENALNAIILLWAEYRKRYPNVKWLDHGTVRQDLLNMGFKDFRIEQLVEMLEREGRAVYSPFTFQHHVFSDYKSYPVKAGESRFHRWKRLKHLFTK